jgi:hypothetical protein
MRRKDMLKLYNTLGRKTEVFHPVNKKVVTIFTCGPSVYQRAHIGNFRTFLFEDILERYLEYSGFSVKRGMNFTDLEDKAIREAELRKLTLLHLTGKNIKHFLHEMKLLCMKIPDYLPKASESVHESVKIIEKLLEEGIAYRYKGNIYFDPLKFQGFGKLYGADFVLFIGNNSAAMAFERARKHAIPALHLATSHFASEDTADETDNIARGSCQTFPPAPPCPRPPGPTIWFDKRPPVIYTYLSYAVRQSALSQVTLNRKRRYRMKRRLILICMLAVIALGAYVAYAYVQGAAPFEKSQKATSDLVVTAATATGACQHNCNPADCQKCPNMQGGKCAMGQGETCQGTKDGTCQHAGNCICPKGPGMTAAGCPGMTAGKCQGTSGAACAGSQAQTAASCAAAKSAGMCAGKSACGSSCPMTK